MHAYQIILRQQRQFKLLKLTFSLVIRSKHQSIFFGSREATMKNDQALYQKIRAEIMERSEKAPVKGMSVILSFVHFCFS